MAWIIIDDELSLKALLAQITHQVEKEKNQLLFIDLEGVNLSRSGQVAIMQILMPPSPVVYLVDVHVLGTKAFEITTDLGTSLKSVLEAKNIFKVFFDIRNDSDALYVLFGVSVAGVIDLQVLEYATRQPQGKFVNGLAKCIERDLLNTTAWATVKANGRRLFAPEAGGKYEVFLDRPMAPDIIKYCEQDVMLMPQLLALYGAKLRPGVAPQLPNIVDERIRLSKTDTFHGKDRHMAIGPYLAAGHNHANTLTSPEVDLVCSTRLGPLCRLNHSPFDNSLLDLVTSLMTNQFVALGLMQEPASGAGNETSDSNCTASASGPRTVDPTSRATPAVTLDEPLDGDKGKDTDGGFEEDRFEDFFGWEGSADIDRGSESDPDFTACSAGDCGYCGKCDY